MHSISMYMGRQIMIMYMGMVCTVLECIWWGYGMHIMRMYMVLVCTVLECIWVWYA